MLSEIARELDETITLKETETRLSNQTNWAGLRECLHGNLLSMAASRIGKDTLLVIDISNIDKKYARSMEYLARVRGGSTGEITDGYWTVKVMGAELREVVEHTRLQVLYCGRWDKGTPGRHQETFCRPTGVRTGTGTN